MLAQGRPLGFRACSPAGPASARPVRSKASADPPHGAFICLLCFSWPLLATCLVISLYAIFSAAFFVGICFPDTPPFPLLWTQRGRTPLDLLSTFCPRTLGSVAQNGRTPPIPPNEQWKLWEESFSDCPLFVANPCKLNMNLQPNKESRKRGLREAQRIAGFHDLHECTTGR